MFSQHMFGFSRQGLLGRQAGEPATFGAKHHPELPPLRERPTGRDSIRAYDLRRRFDELSRSVSHALIEQAR
jgi:hypothetical protein